MATNIKSRLILIGMFVFFAIPIVVVIIMYQYNWRPNSFSYGELIKPIIKINVSVSLLLMGVSISSSTRSI